MAMNDRSLIGTTEPESYNFGDWLRFTNEFNYKQIIESKPFVRLKDISFLGALGYTHDSKIKKEEKNRFSHSIDVAALANFISSKRNYSDDLKKHLIIAALLHDIGHPPLSHSVEPYTKKILGIGHHELSESIIRGEIKGTKSFNKKLRNTVDVDFILELINQTSISEGSDLFNSPINIDTIDGIVRSYTYLHALNPLDQEENRLKVAEASFLDVSNKTDILDMFWKQKHDVYSLLINSERGLVADKTSELFFKNNSITECLLYSNEKVWKKNFELLFLSLKEIKSRGVIPDWIENETVDYKVRKYLVNKNNIFADRYLCQKEVKKFNFKSLANSHKSFQQLSLLS